MKRRLAARHAELWAHGGPTFVLRRRKKKRWLDGQREARSHGPTVSPQWARGGQTQAYRASGSEVRMMFQMFRLFVMTSVEKRPQKINVSRISGLLCQRLHKRKSMFVMNSVFDSGAQLGAMSPMDPRLDEIGSCGLPSPPEIWISNGTCSWIPWVHET